MKRIEVLKGKEKELKSKLEKVNSDKEIWKYAYQNKITEFIETAKGIQRDFFKDNKEVKNFLKLLEIEIRGNAKSNRGSLHQ